MSIEIEPSVGTLFVDILGDPPGLAIRRVDTGLVRVEDYELRRLIEVLTRAERCVVKK